MDGTGASMDYRHFVVVVLLLYLSAASASYLVPSSSSSEINDVIQDPTDHLEDGALYDLVNSLVKRIVTEDETPGEMIREFAKDAATKSTSGNDASENGTTGKSRVKRLSMRHYFNRRIMSRLRNLIRKSVRAPVHYKHVDFSDHIWEGIRR